MGAWGYGNFENDDAMDWLCELVDSRDASILIQPLNNVVNDDDPDSPDACLALAAAEVVAAKQHDDPSQIPEEAWKWLNKRRGLFRKRIDLPADVVDLSKSAVETVLRGSELKDLWGETSYFESWCDLQKDLVKRLSASGA